MVVSDNDDGSLSVSVLDGKSFRLVHHRFPGVRETEGPVVDQGLEKKG